MNKFVAKFLLSLLLYAAYGALFAWGLQIPLENILNQEIQYRDLFMVATLTLVFFTPDQFKTK